jgi:hypothetical protein
MLWYRGANHTSDNVVIADSPDGPKIALIQRKEAPFEGQGVYLKCGWHVQ